MFKDIHIDRDGQLLVDMPAYLRQHTVVYHAPSYEAYDGLGLGTGDIGGLLCVERNQLRFVVNKTDLYDDGHEESFDPWGIEEEEKHTALVSGGAVTFSDQMPSFDTMYLSDFAETLDLGTAQIDLHAKTPFSAWDVEAFASEKQQTVCFHCTAQSEFPTVRKVTVDKWGSRAFFHYYEQYRADPAIRLHTVESGIYADCGYIRCTLRSQTYVLMVKICGGSLRPACINRHTVEFVSECSTQEDFTVLVTIVNDGEDLLEQAYARLCDAATDLSALRQQHRDAWHTFWDKCFVSLPDKYLENLYYIHLYTMQSSMKGPFPPLFTGGIWTWNRDVRNWGHFYHWNNQQQYWSVDSSNHPEFFTNYAAYRRNMLDIAKADAKTVHGIAGAFYSDISNRRGYQAMAPDTISNFTCGPQIALDLYRHYLYTRDEAYLRETALPVMRACAEFYLGKLTLQDDGYYHLPLATVYEGFLALSDTVSDRVFIEALFRSCLEAWEHTNEVDPLAEQMETVLAKLYPFSFTTVDTDDGTVEVLSCGLLSDGTPLGFRGSSYPESAFGIAELSAAFPGGERCMQHMDARTRQALVQTAKVIFSIDDFSCGHTPYAYAAARLGNPELAMEILKTLTSHTQCFRNGMSHFLDVWDITDRQVTYHPRRLLPEDLHTDWSKIHEKQYFDRVSVPADRYLHFYSETMGTFNAAINASLLSSCDGVIRVFPGDQSREMKLFTLCAEGGFLVTSELRDAQVRYLVIESQTGGTCRVENPWDGPVFLRRNGQLERLSDIASVIALDLPKGERVILYPCAAPIDVMYSSVCTADAPPAVRYNGRAVIGMERTF